jgi:hypothetical protein
MHIKTIFLIGTLSPFMMAAAHAQDPGRALDPTPLEHPLPITSVRTSDPAQLIPRIRAALAASGFRVTRVDIAKLTVDAQRNDRQGSKDYDRVIVWLERSLTIPTESYDLFLTFGRYEAMWGRDIYRVRVDDAFVQARISTLRNRLLGLGT